MGYSTRGGVWGSTIGTFTPDDTDTKMYLDGSTQYSFEEILQDAQEKWGQQISFDQLSICTEYIQTDCLGYNSRYDPSDYTMYIVISKKDE